MGVSPWMSAEFNIFDLRFGIFDLDDGENKPPREL
jgi:hypothetical protein